MVAQNGESTAVSRRRLLKSAGAVGAVGLAGCSSTNTIVGDVANDAETTIQYWTLFSGGDGATMKSIVDRFNEQRPLGNVRINRQRIPWDDYYTKIYTALVAETGPDIAVMHQALMGRFQQMLVPLNQHLSDSARSKYLSTLWERMRFDGNQLALPLDAHPVGLYYNTAVFEAAGLNPESPPTNFQEFKKVCNTIVSETDAHAFTPTPYLDPIGMLRTYIAFINQRGGNMFDEDISEITFDSEAGMGVAQLYHDITGQYEWDIANTSANRADVAFQNDELAMTINGTWYAAVLQSLEGFEWGMYKPFVAPGKQQNYTQSGSHTIVLPRNPDRNTQKSRTAVEVAEWITQENPVWGTRAGHLPAARAALNSKALRKSPLWPKSLSKYFQIAQNNQLAYLPRTPFNANNNSTWSFLGDIYGHSVGPRRGIQRGVNNIQRLLNNVD